MKTKPLRSGTSTRDWIDQGASIRFFDDKEGLLSVMEIQAPARPDIIRAIYQALLATRVQVVRCESQNSGDRNWYRLHVVELDGAPISLGRRLQIQSSMIGLAGYLLHDTLPAHLLAHAS